MVILPVLSIILPRKEDIYIYADAIAYTPPPPPEMISRLDF